MAKLVRALITFGSQLWPKRMRSVLDPGESHIATRDGHFETDADPATAAEQSEVSVRKIVDFLQKLRHENIALIKLRVDRKPAFSLARGGGDVFIADEIDATMPMPWCLSHPSRNGRSRASNSDNRGVAARSAAGKSSRRMANSARCSSLRPEDMRVSCRSRTPESGSA